MTPTAASVMREAEALRAEVTAILEGHLWPILDEAEIAALGREAAAQCERMAEAVRTRDVSLEEAEAEASRARGLLARAIVAQSMHRVAAAVLACLRQRLRVDAGVAPS